MTREETTRQSARLVEAALHLRKRALVARLTAIETCLRSEDVLVGLELERLVLDV